MIAALKKFVRNNPVTRRGREAPSEKTLIETYIQGGRIPWTPGYSKYKNQALQATLSDSELMNKFANGGMLPAGFGSRLDERVVECPWAVARLPLGGNLILDAGSVLNSPIFLDQPQMKDRRLVMYSLEMDYVRLDPRLSYVHGDFRESVFRDNLIDTIVCISTLEHVGLWPIPKAPFAESLARPQPPIDLTAYREVLRIFRRMLKPGGRLLLTVPFGRRENHLWLQQFDQAGVKEILAAFGSKCQTQTYYRHTENGWQIARPDECAACEYHNLVTMPSFGADFAAAARAVACLEFVKEGVA